MANGNSFAPGFMQVWNRTWNSLSARPAVVTRSIAMPREQVSDDEPFPQRFQRGRAVFFGRDK